MQDVLDPLAEEFTTFNRQRELERLERERKEQEWEEELVNFLDTIYKVPTMKQKFLQFVPFY